MLLRVDYAGGHGGDRIDAAAGGGIAGRLVELFALAIGRPGVSAGQAMTHRSRTITAWERGLVMLVALVLVTNVASAEAQDSTRLHPPPAAAVRPVTDDYFGTKVVDNYRYFENLKDPEVQQWMKAQAEYTRHRAGPHSGPRRACLARLHELDASDTRLDRRTCGACPGISTSTSSAPASESDLKLYQRTGLSGAERLLVDPGTITLAPQNRGKGPSSIEHVSISGNGHYVAVGITPGGAERDCRAPRDRCRDRARNRRRHPAREWRRGIVAAGRQRVSLRPVSGPPRRGAFRRKRNRSSEPTSTASAPMPGTIGRSSDTT